MMDLSPAVPHPALPSPTGGEASDVQPRPELLERTGVARARLVVARRTRFPLARRRGRAHDSKTGRTRRQPAPDPDGAGRTHSPGDCRRRVRDSRKMGGRAGPPLRTPPGALSAGRELETAAGAD